MALFWRTPSIALLGAPGGGEISFYFPDRAIACSMTGARVRPSAAGHAGAASAVLHRINTRSERIPGLTGNIGSTVMGPTVAAGSVENANPANGSYPSVDGGSGDDLSSRSQTG